MRTDFAYHYGEAGEKMKGVWLIILTAFWGAVGTGCQSGETRDAISQVSYASQAGPILPELQWYEQIVITPTQVRLTRQGGAAETDVNVGNWNLAADEAQIAALFAQLEALDCAKMTRIEPDDPPDGGSTESYVLVYASGRECALLFDPGTTYTQSDRLVTPITQFIQGLSLPAEAANRYQFVSP